MILYDWQKIFNVAKKDPVECFRIFKMIANKEIPKSINDPIYYYSQLDFKGGSFLLHPDVLLFHAYKHTKRDISLYLALASMRSLAEYQANGIITLELIKAPINPQETLRDTDLMPVKDGLIYFKYEETPPKEKQH